MQFDDIAILLPLRMAIIGGMSAGKSSYVLNFIRNIGEITNVEKQGVRFDCEFYYNTISTLKSLYEALESSKYFDNIKTSHGLPTKDDIELLNNKNESNNHRLVIMEDVMYNLRSIDNKVLSKMLQMITNSRHLNISLIVVMHDFGFGSGVKMEFQRNFIKQATVFVVFNNISNTIQTRNFVNRLGYNYNDFLEICNIAVSIVKLDAKHGKFSQPSITINVDVRQHFSDELSRIIVDIFNRKLTFKV